MRKGRRGRTRSEDRSSVFRQPEWAPPVNPHAATELLSSDEVEAIHRASLEVLRDVGMDFLDPRARDILGRHGADVTKGSERVRFAPELIEECLAKAPASFTLHGRDGTRDLVMGGRSINFATVASAPNASDLEGGRRNGSFQDFNDFVRLGQACNIIHLYGGYPVEPVDLPPETRHLDCHLTFLTLSDKVWHVYSLGGGRVRDAIDMACIARRRTHEQLRDEPSIFSVINTSSPLRVDGPMLEGVIELAEAGQAVVVTPFTLSGAMSSVTIAGALTQQNAEALAVIAFTQMVRPGAPVVYGGFTSNVDMRSGAPAFGTPEYAKAVLAGGQLARRHGIPYRSSNVNAANIPDGQAAYESMMGLWPVVMGQDNLVMHGAGWMEGGLTASFEKFMIDVELLQGMAEFLTPLRVDEQSLALDAIREVGPGGHFFGTPHTMERYQTAFHEPILSDWRNFETWSEAGGLTVLERAHALYKAVLADFQPPDVDPGVEEELRAFVERRRREIQSSPA